MMSDRLLRMRYSLLPKTRMMRTMLQLLVEMCYHHRWTKCWSQHDPVDGLPMTLDEMAELTSHHCSGCSALSIVSTTSRGEDQWSDVGIANVEKDQEERRGERTRFEGLEGDRWLGSEVARFSPSNNTST